MARWMGMLLTGLTATASVTACVGSVDNSRQLADPNEFSLEITHCGPNAERIMSVSGDRVQAEPNQVVYVEFDVTNLDDVHRYFDYDVYVSSTSMPEELIRKGDVSLEPGESGTGRGLTPLPDNWEDEDFSCRVEIRHSLMDDIPQLNEDG